MQHNLSIDDARVWTSLMDMADIGATAAGGCNRQALTDVDRAGRELFQYWCTDAGLKVDVDDVGNMFARREGYDSSLPLTSTERSGSKTADSSSTSIGRIRDATRRQHAGVHRAGREDYAGLLSVVHFPVDW
jgi:hypothetical protein